MTQWSYAWHSVGLKCIVTITIPHQVLLIVKAFPQKPTFHTCALSSEWFHLIHSLRWSVWACVCGWGCVCGWVCVCRKETKKKTSFQDSELIFPILKYVCVYVYTHTNTDTQTNTNIYTNTDIYKNTHTHKYTHTQIQTHTQPCSTECAQLNLPPSKDENAHLRRMKWPEKVTQQMHFFKGSDQESTFH